MSADLVIRRARIFDPSQNLDLVGDILIENGKIQALGNQITVPPGKPIPELDAQGWLVTPGWIDIHTHLREPGQTHKETIKTGTEAAAAGGFTSIACMANTKPVNDSSFITTYIQQKVAADSLINVYPIGAITKGLEGQELAEIGSMWEAGIVAISDDGKTVMNSYLMRKALDYSKRFNLPVVCHAEDAHLKGRGVMNEGFNSARFGLRGIPKASEEIIVARDILLTELTGARLHVAHVSTAGSVALIREAKRRGIRITAEVTPHHLTLTDEVVGTYDTNTKVAPPLREPQDIEAVTEALADGTIDIVATDHAPHPTESKECEWQEAAFGMLGLETALSIVQKTMVDTGLMNWNQVSDRMSITPARIGGYENHGQLIAVGSIANLVVINPTQKWTVDRDLVLSKSSNTPYHGHELPGVITHTFFKGYATYNQGTVSSNGGKK